MATAGVAGAAALAAYLDARFHIRYDLSTGSLKVKRMLWMMAIAKQSQSGKVHIYHLFEDRASTPMGDLTFIIFEGREWTYRDFYKAIQPVGNWLLDLGIEKGEMVALDGGNSVELLLLWFALEAIGAAVAFINCNLTGKALVHCVKVAGARYLLADSDVRQLVSPAEDELVSAGAQTIYYSTEFFETLTNTEPLPASRRTGADPMDVAGLLYTSGTTGMPKGTVVTRARLMMISLVGSRIGLKPGDRMYTCLPLYHASAQVVCCLPCIASGATMVLSRKFSHSTFWPEVHASKANIIQYVGELCRYLLNAPPSPLDRGHRVQIAWGNGMRPDVWEPFRERFGIEIIHEFYAATDGMAGMLANLNRGDFSRGAVAVRGPLWHLLNGADEARVAVDPDTQEIIRGKNGFAVRCKADEPGEMIHRMDPKNPQVGSPAYYNNAQAAEKRRVADVFAKGDLWFRSGDLMRLDSEGRLCFVDRLGDTFRWHSENVSTNEVGEVVSLFPQVLEANVYGVLVPNADGRAGCAAIVVAEGVSTRPEDIASGRGLDLKGLAEHCLASLPRYAVPLFLRVVEQLEYTATMKLQKGRLRSEGIDLEVIEKAAKEKGQAADVIYWLPPNEKTYVKFKNEDLVMLRSGGVRL
ncbi:fatty acid transporter [Hypoxylon cercidicola]|nr:fatty acid transporter [Hypoxylon cercidicola]